MFNESIDIRLSKWANHRQSIETSQDPLQEVWEFWKSAPFVPYNSKIDPHHRRSWPTPWDIIVENKYDDFTRALMIALTLQLTDRYSNITITIKTLVDKIKNRQYNIVCVEDQWAVNYGDLGAVPIDQLSENLYLENLIEINSPR